MTKEGCPTMGPNKESILAVKPLRSNDIRQRNEKLVLNLIYAHSGISQSEIVSITGLKPPTVFRIFTELESNGVIRACNEEKTQSDRKGRRPSYYCVNPDSYYSVGVDFWSGSASTVIVDFGGNVVYQGFSELPRGIDANSVTERLKESIHRAINEAGVDKEKILGVGVGAPGIVDIVEGLVLRYPRIGSMTDYPIGDMLSEEFRIPVYVHNNCSVIALSEYRYRKIEGQQSVFAFLIRSGVGGAFIQEGTAFVNHNVTALEVGHLSVDPNGTKCECGAAGCLETYLNEDNLLGTLAEKAGCGTWEELEDRLGEGDERVRTVLRGFADLLVNAATSISNLLNPSAFLVVTRYQRCAEFFADELNTAFARPGHALAAANITAVGRKYDPSLACKGAADLVLDHFFQGVI
jgi:predicted NBD/HSP70 family sugar kinase